MRNAMVVGILAFVCAGCGRSVTQGPGEVSNLEQWTKSIQNKKPERQRDPLPLLMEQQVFSYADHANVSINPNPESALKRAQQHQWATSVEVQSPANKTAIEAAWNTTAQAYGREKTAAELERFQTMLLAVSAPQDENNKPPVAPSPANNAPTPDSNTSTAPTTPPLSSTAQLAQRVAAFAASGYAAGWSMEELVGVAATAPTAEPTAAALQKVDWKTLQVPPAAASGASVLNTPVLKVVGQLQAWRAGQKEQHAEENPADNPQNTAMAPLMALSAPSSVDRIAQATAHIQQALETPKTHASDASAMALRSPFDLPFSAQPVASGVRPDSNRPKQALEGFALDSLLMVGTVGRGPSLVALVMSPDKVVYRVGVGQYLGQQDGRVVRVKDNEISLVELVSDGNGGWSEQTASIPLRE